MFPSSNSQLRPRRRANCASQQTLRRFLQPLRLRATANLAARLRAGNAPDLDADSVERRRDIAPDAMRLCVRLANHFVRIGMPLRVDACLVEAKQERALFSCIARLGKVAGKAGRKPWAEATSGQPLVRLAKLQDAVNLLHAVTLLHHVPIQVGQPLRIVRLRNDNAARIDALGLQSNVEHPYVLS